MEGLGMQRAAATTKKVEYYPDNQMLIIPQVIGNGFAAAGAVPFITVFGSCDWKWTT